MSDENPAESNRDTLKSADAAVMARLKNILVETNFELEPICLYVILDKLRGTSNSAGIPESTYQKTEQLLRILGVDAHWKS